MNHQLYQQKQALSIIPQIAANGGLKITLDAFVKKKFVVLFVGCSLTSLQYVPAPQESVVGAIIGKLGEGFKVDIGAAHPALLDGLAFEGATKRNKPNLKVSTSSIASYVHS